ncbi:MAG: hypothetical protein GY841_15710 [FCB group bacterium]|nr:hypothetical protein [FCB group bacterium]
MKTNIHGMQVNMTCTNDDGDIFSVTEHFVASENRKFYAIGKGYEGSFATYPVPSELTRLDEAIAWFKRVGEGKVIAWQKARKDNPVLSFEDFKNSEAEDTSEHVEVKLVTENQRFVDIIKIPRFYAPPKIILWKDRSFIFAEEEPYGGYKIYAEVFAHNAVE